MRSNTLYLILFQSLFISFSFLISLILIIQTHFLVASIILLPSHIFQSMQWAYKIKHPLFNPFQSLFIYSSFLISHTHTRIHFLFFFLYIFLIPFFFLQRSECIRSNTFYLILFNPFLSLSFLIPLILIHTHTFFFSIFFNPPIFFPSTK